MPKLFSYRQYTLLAPTDDAFRKLPKGLYDKLVNNPVIFEELLNSHFVRTTPDAPYTYATLTKAKTGTKVRGRGLDCGRGWGGTVGEEDGEKGVSGRYFKP